MEQIEVFEEKGEYVVTVFAKSVPHGPQPYSLVVTGEFSYYPSGCSGTLIFFSSNNNLGSCPNNCSSNGNCINGVCICLKEFAGPDCSMSKFFSMIDSLD